MISRNPLHPKNPKTAAIVAIVCLILSSCTLTKLRQEVDATETSTILIGHVFGRVAVNSPLVVVAYNTQNGERLVSHYTVLDDYGEFELMVTKGEYHVFAYVDTNSNLVYDKGEPAAQFGAPDLIFAPSGGIVQNIEIFIQEITTAIDWPIGKKIADITKHAFHSRLAGSITTLDDEIFLDEYGGQGFWEPVSFYKQFGGTIYFLEEYDPHKIPLLFIHGAGGTPRGWKYFVDNIDRERFQPWFFYYPSGARMRSMSHLLLWKLTNLQVKYRFKELYITAHSMGGLIARSFIMDFGRDTPYVKLLISLATPWGGDKMAEYGVKQSPAVIPCWLDMQPEGRFIQSLFQSELPDPVGFYIFFGHAGNRNPFRSNNDGTITLSSLLDRRAQSEADMLYGFNEDHASIMQSKEVMEQYNAILNSYAGTQNAAQQPSGGSIRVQFAFDQPQEYITPWPNLTLRSTEDNKAETTITLRPQDKGNAIGPFPTGNYLARLYLGGFKTKKEWVPITIRANNTSNLEFALTPDGTISGYIIEALPEEDKVVGMPEWEQIPQNNPISVERITLKGNGISRSLDSCGEKDFNWEDQEISRTDYCYRGWFRFFGLRAGEYELVMQAAGYKVLKAYYTVTPGKESPTEFFEMRSVQKQQE
ncbi:lipase family alpha/beta hydrolase [Desulfogranum japonicum]|uniref:lipase family alpha/beta hydrolase n=1 Tax=Desulfogranum japonicum TaxID=231447 RepID=UPI00048EB8C8|nr:alpha/beta hydrolase [Desulfogranum japonicum]